jgi:hypothetical protein
MGFDNTSEERITKEMITDYHKKEQDRIEERLTGRTKTSLHDTIDSEIVTPLVEYKKNQSKLKRLSPTWNELQKPIMKYYVDLKQARSSLD